MFVVLVSLVPLLFLLMEKVFRLTGYSSIGGRARNKEKKKTLQRVECLQARGFEA